MRISYDAKTAFNNSTGLGNYGRFIISSMVEHHKEHFYSLLTPSFNPELAGNFSRFTNGQTIMPGGFWQKKFPSLWRSYGVRKLIKSDADLYHGLSAELPYGIRKSKVAKVVTIHDLIALRYPHFYPYLDRTIFNEKSKHACKIADGIVAISHQTKQDIIDFYGVNPNKISVIYQDCHPIFYYKPDLEFFEVLQMKYNLPENYIICVSTLEERKNQLRLIQAMSLVRGHDDIKLVLAGKDAGYKKKLVEEIKKLHLEDRVLFLDYVDFNDLPVLYRNATFAVYPSLFEGFGIPILEALHSDVCVLTSKGSCFEEAGGNAALYVEPTSPDSIAEGVKTLLENPGLRAQLAINAKTHLKQFHTKIISNQLNNLYLKLGR